MTDRQRDRQPTRDQARKRLAGTLAAEFGVRYSVALRMLDATAPVMADLRASRGRTVYPWTSDIHRQRLISRRAARTREQWVQDARRAGDLPCGRAWHFADRFPPTRGEKNTGVGMLYGGAGRQDALGLLYLVAVCESPQLVPSVGQLAWVAELGEETAVDVMCAGLDRAARLLLNDTPASLAGRICSALRAGASHEDWWIRENTARLAAAYATMATPQAGAGEHPPALEGAQHILDALLVIADDGHAPGARVRILTDPSAAAPRRSSARSGRRRSRSATRSLLTPFVPRSWPTRMT